MGWDGGMGRSFERLVRLSAEGCQIRLFMGKSILTVYSLQAKHLFVSMREPGRAGPLDAPLSCNRMASPGLAIAGGGSGGPALPVAHYNRHGELGSILIVNLIMHLGGANK